MGNSKRELGQYFTKGNPFKHPLFKKWIEMAETEVLLEPFAGANCIPELMKESGYDFRWKCYDIEPPARNNLPDFTVEKRDVLEDFPSGFKTAITNPPYLAKNSATRRGITYKWKYDDIYKVCVETMLESCRYVAVIIPESFLTAGIFKERLWGIVSLAFKMFDDTDCPVCLAMFTPDGSSGNTQVFSNDEFLGTMEELERMDIEKPETGNRWVFNDPTGSIGVKTVDGVSESSQCMFMDGNLIESGKIKVSSRSYTRVSGLPDGIDTDDFIEKCNDRLDEYRKRTKDIFMTSFKGLRHDGKYRRRLDFGTVRRIMDRTVEDF